MPYFCSCCGQAHEGLPDVAFDRPAYAHDVPADEQTDRVELDSDLCIVDGQYYFIRGLLEIPVHGLEETLGIGVWVSQKAENFFTYTEHFDSAEIGPFFGWLSNEFSFGGEPTLGIKTMAHFRGDNLRPRIELEPTDHPLSIAQRVGVGLDEAWGFVHRYLAPTQS